jgi:hypothetical protein
MIGRSSWLCKTEIKEEFFMSWKLLNFFTCHKPPVISYKISSTKDSTYVLIVTINGRKRLVIPELCDGGCII